MILKLIYSIFKIVYARWLKYYLDHIYNIFGQYQVLLCDLFVLIWLIDDILSVSCWYYSYILDFICVKTHEFPFVMNLIAIHCVNYVEIYISQLKFKNIVWHENVDTTSTWSIFEWFSKLFWVWLDIISTMILVSVFLEFYNDFVVVNVWSLCSCWINIALINCEIFGVLWHENVHTNFKSCLVFEWFKTKLWFVLTIHLTRC